MLDIFIESLIDSLKASVVVFLIYIVISFVERKVSSRLTLKSKLSPIYGALVGIIPQCGFSIVSADLYKKRHITMGTLISVFIACSDEAIPLFISNAKYISMVIPLIVLKLIYAICVGLLVDLIFYKRNQGVIEHHHVCHHEEETHVGCCNHDIEKSQKGNQWFGAHIVHPLVHTLKIFTFMLIINIIFGLLIYYLTENVIMNFLTSYKYLTPVFASLIGIIPNCASSVILTELYFSGVLEFGALFAGLCCNAGLGLVYIFKRKEIKENIIILSILLLSSIMIGYVLMVLFY